MIFIGIDPGVSGAVAVIAEDDSVAFYDTPTNKVVVGKRIKNELDAVACALLLNEITKANRGDAYVIMEKVQPMPSFKIQRKGEEPTEQSMGVTSAFNFGKGFGIWIGILGALMLRHDFVHPVTWKRFMLPGMDKAKANSIVRAKQLFPRAAPSLERKKDADRAEALLMAEYGRRTYSSSRAEVKKERTIKGSLFEEEPF